MLDFCKILLVENLLRGGCHDNAFGVPLLGYKNHNAFTGVLAEFPGFGGFASVVFHAFTGICDIVCQNAGDFGSGFLEKLLSQVVEQLYLVGVQEVVLVVDSAFGGALRVPWGVRRCFSRRQHGNA